MKSTRLAVPGFLIFSLCLPQGAFAACAGREPLYCGAGTARIASDDGLQLSRGGDFAPLAPGSGLRLGDRILTGAADSKLTIGSCRTVIAAGSLVSITRSGAQTCASIAGPAGAPIVGPVGASPVAYGVGAAATTALVVGIVLATQNGNGGVVSGRPNGNGGVNRRVSGQ